MKKRLMMPALLTAGLLAGGQIQALEFSQSFIINY